MNGRKEKARQGGWNGGFASYGYYLKDKQPSPQLGCTH